MPRSRKKTPTDVWQPDRWEEPAPARQPITRQQLVRNALVLLDELGFDGLTMRRLAERVGDLAASLYNHVRDKDELLAMVADAIGAEVAPPDPAHPWRVQLETLANDFRPVLLDHRDAAHVLAATPPVGLQRLRLSSTCSTSCAGLDDASTADAAYVLTSSVVGCVLDETQFAVARDDAAFAEAHEQVRTGLKALPPERYPRLNTLADHLLARSTGRRFAFGLRVLLDGLALRVSSTH